MKDYLPELLKFLRYDITIGDDKKLFCLNLPSKVGSK